MRYALILAGLLMMHAGTAHAQRQWPAWYVGLHGSVAFIDQSELDGAGSAVTPKLEYDTGYGVGAALGYRLPFTMAPWNGFRVEAEIHHEAADIDTTSLAGTAFPAASDVETTAYMGNLYYDFILDNGLKPYLGGGLGWANVDLDFDEDDTFAYQLMAGLGYAPELIPFTEWTLGYRFFGTGDPEFDNGAGRTEMKYDSHHVEAGVKFLF